LAVHHASFLTRKLKALQYYAQGQTTPYEDIARKKRPETKDTDGSRIGKNRFGIGNPSIIQPINQSIKK